MKKVLFVVLVVGLTIGCKANQNKSDVNKLCDSIVGLIQEHPNNQMLQYAKDNWGELKRNILESWR